MTDTNDGYRHIVVGLDGGNEGWAALDEAIRLARSSKGRLDLLVAVPDKADSKQRYADIADVAASRAGGVLTTTYLVDGDPAAALIEHAERAHCDLIVLGCRSRLGPNPGHLGEHDDGRVGTLARAGADGAPHRRRRALPRRSHYQVLSRISAECRRRRTRRPMA